MRLNVGMTARLPPLNALRTFEAAARHLSFTKAAAELFVTQAAISHQIRTLEDHLGARLFRRMNRALLLTDEGQALLPAVREAFDRLSAGVRRVQDLRCGGALTISTTPSFAASWLAHRLVRFQIMHPEVELQLSATARLVDFAREGIDYSQLADRHRQERAQRMLRQGTGTQAVAEAVGFSDSRCFRRAFRRWTGMAPSEYRARAGQAAKI